MSEGGSPWVGLSTAGMSANPPPGLAILLIAIMLIAILLIAILLIDIILIAILLIAILLIAILLTKMRPAGGPGAETS